MIGGVSDMQWIAAAFGPGVVRPSSPMRGSQETVGPARLPDDEKIGPFSQGQEDSVEISALGRQAAEEAGLFPTQESSDSSTARSAEAPAEQTPAPDSQTPSQSQEAQPSSEAAPAEKNVQGEELSEEEQAQVDELKQRDQEVRRHEQAHIAAGGQLAKGGASFEYQTGPDGKRYAVGGEVQIDTSTVQGDPEATIRKMQQIQRAAMAPAEPSSQDRQVAAQARAAQAEARAELREERQAEASGSSEATGEAAKAGETKPGQAVSEVPGEEQQPKGVKGMMEAATQAMSPQAQEQGNQSPIDFATANQQANAQAINAYQNDMSIRSTLNMVA